MNKLIKLGIIGVAGFVVISFFSGKAQKAYAGARDQLPIRLYRGRSNYRGTRLGNKRSMRNLAGNRTQRRSQRHATRLMRRG